MPVHRTTRRSVAAQEQHPPIDRMSVADVQNYAIAVDDLSQGREVDPGTAATVKKLQDQAAILFSLCRFVCALCWLPWKTPCDFLRHNRTHLPVSHWPFKCEHDNCNFSTTQRGNLLEHLRFRHNNVQRPCGVILSEYADGRPHRVCSRILNSSVELTRHRQPFHGWPTRGGVHLKIYEPQTAGVEDPSIEWVRCVDSKNPMWGIPVNQGAARTSTLGIQKKKKKVGKAKNSRHRKTTVQAASIHQDNTPSGPRRSARFHARPATYAEEVGSDDESNGDATEDEFHLSDEESAEMEVENALLGEWWEDEELDDPIAVDNPIVVGKLDVVSEPNVADGLGATVDEPNVVDASDVMDSSDELVGMDVLITDGPNIADEPIVADDSDAAVEPEEPIVMADPALMDHLEISGPSVERDTSDKEREAAAALLMLPNPIPHSWDFSASHNASPLSSPSSLTQSHYPSTADSSTRLVTPESEDDEDDWALETASSKFTLRPATFSPRAKSIEIPEPEPDSFSFWSRPVIGELPLPSWDL